jgi:hypothetical protein
MTDRTRADDLGSRVLRELYRATTGGLTRGGVALLLHSVLSATYPDMHRVPGLLRDRLLKRDQKQAFRDCPPERPQGTAPNLGLGLSSSVPNTTGAYQNVMARGPDGTAARFDAAVGGAQADDPPRRLQQSERSRRHEPRCCPLKRTVSRGRSITCAPPPTAREPGRTRAPRSLRPS